MLLVAVFFNRISRSADRGGEVKALVVGPLKKEKGKPQIDFFSWPCHYGEGEGRLVKARALRKKELKKTFFRWPLSSRGGGVVALMARPLKKTPFLQLFYGTRHTFYVLIY